MSTVLKLKLFRSLIFGALWRNNMSSEKRSEIYFLSERILYVSFTFYAKTQVVSVIHFWGMLKK